MSSFRGPSAPPGPEEEIPDKLYFKIGEVSRLVGVQAHVLRYWEKEIPSIRPSKSASNQRRYRRKDVETFREIRRLLYEERYTLAGAKQRLSGRDPHKVAEKAARVPEPVVPSVAPPAAVASAQLDALRGGLQDLIRLAGEEP